MGDKKGARATQLQEGSGFFSLEFLVGSLGAYTSVREGINVSKTHDGSIAG